MRLSKAPRKIYPHGTSRRSARSSPRPRSTGARDRAALPADPRRDRRRVQHGRRHRAAARDRRGGRGVRCAPSSSTTRMPRASSAGTAAAPSTTSGSTAGSRSRSARCRKAVGVLGGYVAGSQDLRDILTQRARPFLFSTSHPPAVAAACLEAIRVIQDEPGAHRAALGEHPAVQGGARPARVRHRRLGDADHAGDDGRPGDRGPVQRPAVRGGRLRPAGRLPDGRPGQGPDPDDRHRRPHRRAARPRAGGVRSDRPRARVSSAG